eukprot:468757-Amphidinium_carterae.1
MYATWRASDTDKCLSEAHALAVTTLMLMMYWGRHEDGQHGDGASADNSMYVTWRASDTDKTMTVRGARPCGDHVDDAR